MVATPVVASARIEAEGQSLSRWSQDLGIRLVEGEQVDGVKPLPSLAMMMERVVQVRDHVCGNIHGGGNVPAEVLLYLRGVEVQAARAARCIG